jgi:CubicO group peptidase (beta-lactamase class C family)
MNMTKLGCLCAVFIVLLAGCATAPLKPANATRGDYGYTKEYVSWLIREEMAKQQVTGLSIALVDNQQVVWAEGFGHANKAADIKATPETIYRAGSISKLFTATAAMQLVDDGQLDIDKPLQFYLPEFTINSRFPDAAPLTARAILTHHSGLPSDLLKGMWTDRPATLGEELLLLKEQYVANPPGYVFAYSNVGMSLLGHAVEKIAGRDIDAQISVALFMPLRMTSSTFSPKIDHSSLGSKAYRKGEPAVEPPLRDIPAGGLNTTVLDLSNFISMVFADGWFKGRQVVKADTLAEMLRPQNSRVPLDLSFRVGLGWMLGAMGGLDIKNAGPVAHHGGATINHRSQLIILPEQKLGVVVLANSASAGSVVNKVATEALKLALEAKAGITQQPMAKGKDAELAKAESRKQLQLALEAQYGTTQPVRPQQAAKPGLSAVEGRGTLPTEGDGTEPIKERKPLTAAEVQAYAGRYDTVAGLVSVRNKSGYLEASLLDRSVRLTPRPDGLLGMSYRFLGLFPVSLGELDRVYIDREIISGRDILKAVIDGNEYLIGERLKPGPIPEKWRQRTGEYAIVNGGDDTILLENIRLRIDGDILIVEYAMPLFSDQTMSVALTPLSETEAVISGLGRGKGETIRVITRKKEEFLAFSGYELQKKGSKKPAKADAAAGAPTE